MKMLSLLLSVALILIAVDSQAGQRTEALQKAVTGDWAQVESLLSSGKSNGDPVLVWLSGLALLERGDWLQAFARLNELSRTASDQQVVVDAAAELVRSDRTGMADFLLADALTRGGRQDEALKHLEDARSKGTSGASLETLYGVILLLEGRDQEAEQRLDRALVQNPKSVDALLARTVARLRRGDIEAAWADVTTAMDLAPGLPAVTNLHGVTTYFADDLLSAMEDFRVAASSQGLKLAAGSNLRLVAQALSSSAQATDVADDEGMKIRLTLADAVTRINETIGFLEAVSGRKLDPNVKIPLTFLPAVVKDFNLAREGRLTSPLVSHTLEEVGRFGLKTLPDLVESLKQAGRLPQTFSVPPALFGIDKLVAGGASVIGSRRVGVEEITQLLDGVGIMASAVAGGLVGTLVGAPGGPAASAVLADRFAKSFAAGARLLLPITRALTAPTIQALVKPDQRQFIENWAALTESAVARGLTVPTLSGLYGEKLLKEAGFAPGDIRRRDAAAHWLNGAVSQGRIDLPLPSLLTQPDLFRGKPYYFDQPPPPRPLPATGDGREGGVRFREELKTEQQWKSDGGETAMLAVVLRLPGAALPVPVPGR